MKFIFFLLISIFSAMSFAGETYICFESGGDEYGPYKMILTQVGDEAVTEGNIHSFKLQLFQGNELLLAEAVNVRTEDVMFRFTNSKKKISGLIFLDELEETSLNVANKKYRFNCN